MEETKKCPYCGEEILTEAKKCKYCGEWLTEDNQEKKKKEQKPCSICGEMIDADAEVCPYCNEKIGPDSDIKTTDNIAPERTSRKELKEASNNNVEDTATYDDDEGKPGLIEHYFVDVFFKHYVDFQGSISRKQFWIGYLFYMIIFILLVPIGLLIKVPYLLTVYLLATIIPCIAYSVRRLHDTGKSGWWIFTALVPVVGTIWLLVLLCQKGELKDESVEMKLIDKIAIGVVSIVALIAIVLGLREINIAIRKFNGTYETPKELANKLPSDSTAEFNSGKTKTEEINKTKYGKLIATSTSGKYEYYLKENNTHIYQRNTETGNIRTITIEESIPDVDIIIAGITDYTTCRNKLIFISDNGGSGTYSACDAFYLNLDNQTWHYICFAKYIQFNENKTVLKTSSPTDESFEHFDENEIQLSDLD